MKIQILATGSCSKCTTMVNNVTDAITEMGINVKVEKITDLNKIIAFGVMSTPGLAINNKVLSSGRVLSVQRIKELIQGELH